VEHALELETSYVRFETLHIALDIARRRLVVLALGELEQLRCIGDAFGGTFDLGDLRREARAFAP
jgi:hypothetical protein